MPLRSRFPLRPALPLPLRSRFPLRPALPLRLQPPLLPFVPSLSSRELFLPFELCFFPFDLLFRPESERSESLFSAPEPSKPRPPPFFSDSSDESELEPPSLSSSTTLSSSPELSSSLFSLSFALRFRCSFREVDLIGRKVSVNSKSTSIDWNFLFFILLGTLLDFAGFLPPSSPSSSSLSSAGASRLASSDSLGGSA